MPLATLNGFDVLEARVSLPRVGAWQADVRVDKPDGIDGAATLIIDGGLTFAGTVARGGAFLEATWLRIGAGADGLRKQARPKFYNATALRIVLSDLLATAGEKLSATADPRTLGARLDGWTTIAQPIGNAVAVLVARGAPADTAWRMLPDGSFWLGAETWPDSGLTDANVDTLEERPELGQIMLGTVAPALRPGTTLAGRRVSYVDHVITPEAIRTRVLLEAS